MIRFVDKIISKAADSRLFFVAKYTNISKLMSLWTRLLFLNENHSSIL